MAYFHGISVAEVSNILGIANTDTGVPSVNNTRTDSAMAGKDLSGFLYLAADLVARLNLLGV